MLTKDREAEIRNNPFHPNGRGSDYLESALRDVLAALDSERQTVAKLRALVIDAREIIADVTDGFEWKDKDTLEEWLTQSQIVAPEETP